MEDAGKIAAVNRAQAVIEFKMDGTILTANENFLNAMSYSLAEIKGQHHSMFIEPNEKNSAAIVGLLAAGDVASSLTAIKAVIAGVNEFMASTAAAVEEQSIVTSDMSANMQRASAGLA
jgi:methyl-accepting chemotaxis protein